MVIENKLFFSNRKYTLDIIVFVCGAAVMIFELIGSRIISPYVGSSIYTWTSLIGIILASLSFGCYVGGNLADQKPTMRPLALIILISAIAIAFCILIKDAFSEIIVGLQTSLEIKSIIISLMLFAPTSFFLGMVSPYAVRLRMSDLNKSGQIAGNLYALSTAGSIFGTFLAGFYIIPHFGSTNSLVIISSVLLLLAVSLLIDTKIRKSTSVVIFLLFIFFGLTYSDLTSKNKLLIADVDTKYSRIFVFSANDPLTKKPIRVLTNTPHGIQAAMFTDGFDDLVLSYQKAYNLFSHFVPNPKNALMIGGSAYTYPRYFIKKYPDAKMDVVEIDPGMTDVARKYFGLETKNNLTIFHQDGRLYLNNNKKKYNVIFVDAFNSAGSIPFHLTTKEFVSKEYEALDDNGLVLVNIVSAIEGDGGKFARAEYLTYKKVFPQVFLFTATDTEIPTDSQNLILLALKSDKVFEWKSADSEMNKFFSQIWSKSILNDVPLLTDDFAPVEYYSHFSL